MSRCSLMLMLPLAQENIITKAEWGERAVQENGNEGQNEANAGRRFRKLRARRSVEMSTCTRGGAASVVVLMATARLLE